MNKLHEISQEYSLDFVLTKEILQKLVNEMLEFFTETFDIDFETRYRVDVIATNSTHESISLAQVFELNKHENNIEQLYIEFIELIEDDEYQFICDIWFSNSKEYSWSKSIQYRVEFRNKLIAERIEQIFIDVIHLSLPKKDDQFIKIGVYLIDHFDKYFSFLILVFLVVILKGNSIYFITPISEMMIGDFLICILLFIWIGVIIEDFLNKLIRTVKDLLKNEPLFLWGDIRKIYDTQIRLKNNIIWVIIIGFIVSFLAGIATFYITK